MDIVYSGLHLSMATVEEFGLESVYEPNGVDYLFTRYRVVGNAVVNGQTEVRDIAGPPVSYQRGGGKDITDAETAWRDGKPPATPDPIFRSDLDVLDRPDGARADPAHVARRGVYARRGSDLKFIRLTATPNPAPLTHQAIRHRLMTPRAPLYVFSGTGDPTVGQLLLKSPADPKFHCDALNGPKPLFFNLLYSAGDGDTFIVRYGIETYLNESTDNGLNGSGNFLLSNRFSMRHSATEDGVTFIDVDGEAYFRTDQVYAPGQVGPDSIRSRLLLPIPFGHVREGLVVEGMPAANGVRYSFRDRLQGMHFPAGPFVNASRIEALHTQTVYTDTDLLKTTCDLVSQTASTILNNRLGASIGDAPKPGAGPALPSRLRVPGAGSAAP